MTDQPTRQATGASAADSSTAATTSSTTDPEPVDTDHEDSPDAREQSSVEAGDAKNTSLLARAGRFVREVVVIVVVALVASALLRAFVVQAFFVPSGSMLPEIQLDDRILVSQIDSIERGEVVVFEDPGGWIPATEQAPPPGRIRSAFEFIGVLPASGHDHLVKRVIGLPGDHVICCDRAGKVTINGYAVDESDFIAPGQRKADNTPFDVIVPKDHVFVLGDNRYISGDSAKHIGTGDPFIPTDLVTGRAFAVIWPTSNAHLLRIPKVYDDVPDAAAAPDEGVINPVRRGAR